LSRSEADAASGLAWAAERVVLFLAKWEGAGVNDFKTEFKADSNPTCPLCGHVMCEHGDCTSPQVLLANGRCFNCGNIECPNFVLPPCVDSHIALPWMI
jgi:hypothetical protein